MRFLLLFFLAIATNAQAEIVQLSADTYLAIRTSRAGMFGSMAGLKAATIREANEFAAAHRKTIIPISTQERPAGRPGEWPTVEYQFRLVAKDDPAAANGVALVPRPDVVVETNSHTDTKAVEEKKPDLYTELTKLDELRKRGLLTDQEFEEQKRRLLQ